MLALPAQIQLERVSIGGAGTRKEIRKFAMLIQIYMPMAQANSRKLNAMAQPDPPRLDDDIAASTNTSRILTTTLVSKTSTP